MTENNGALEQTEGWDDMDDQEKIARLDERLRAHIRTCEREKSTKRWVATIGVTLLVGMISIIVLLLDHISNVSALTH